MTLSLVLFGILPLIAFALIDSFFGVKAGVIAAITLGLVELFYSFIVDRSLDYVALCSVGLIIIFGFLSIRSKNALYIKMQPVLIGSIFAAVLLGSSFMGTPLLVLLAQKYQNLLPKEAAVRLLRPESLALLHRLNFVLGIGFFIHAFLVAIVAFYLNTWWWLTMRGLGVYAMMVICTLYVRFL